MIITSIPLCSPIPPLTSIALEGRACESVAAPNGLASSSLQLNSLNRSHLREQEARGDDVILYLRFEGVEGFEGLFLAEFADEG